MFPSPQRAFRLAAWLCAGAALASCSPHRVNTDPGPPVPVPASFGSESGEAAMNDRWWTDFHDPSLESLIERALGGNFQLQGAWARLTQAEAAIRTARSGRWPKLDFDGDIARRDAFFPPFGKITQKTYSLSVPVAYELDVWNKYGSGIDAAAALARASRDDLEATAMSLAAEVSEAWFDVVATRCLDELLRAQLEVNEASEEVLESRFGKGLAAAVDVYQQRAQSITTRTLVEQNIAQLVTAQNQLSILLGKPSTELAIPTGDELPALSEIPNVGVPADLLERRPDMRATRERLVAQDHYLAQAIAERLPTLTLTASLGFSATSPTELLDNLLTSIGGGVHAPLINGGLRAAKQRAQEGAVAEAVAAYGQTLLTALVEVENALVRDRQQEKVIVLLEAQRETSEAGLRAANGRYMSGVDTYLPVLTANGSLQNAERALVEAKRQRISIRIQLFRALGGTWTAALERPDTKESS